MSDGLSIDFAIILALLEKPLSSAVELSSDVNSRLKHKKMSESTVKRKLRYLIDYTDREIEYADDQIIPESSKHVRSELKGAIRGVTASINYDLLDMQIHSFILLPDKKNWRKNFEKIDIFCDNHPYTVFKTQIFGDRNAVFAQFAILKKYNSVKLLLFAFDELINNKVIENYEHFMNINRTIKSNSQLSKWDETIGKWTIELDKITETVAKQFEDSNIIKSEKNIVANLKIFDVILIREMTKNARRSQSELLENIPKIKYYKKVIQKLPLTKQSISRHLSYLKNINLFSNYNLVYDRIKFGMFNQVLYIIDTDDKKMSGLIKCIKDGIIPFPGSLFQTSTAWILWLNIPPVEMIEITEIISASFPQMRYFIMMLA